MKTTTLFVIVLSFSFSIVTAQTAPGKQWDARFGGSNYDELWSLQQTADGGYILGGYSESEISGDKTQASQGYWDYWIVKTDDSGVKQWDARFGGRFDDILYSLQQTADGGYILGGYSSSGISGDKTQASQGGYDYWIVKTDAGGVKQWDARFGGSGNDYLHSLQQTADGGYILGGYSNSGISGDKTQESQGRDDYWIVKTDAGGVKQWDARFGGDGEDYLYSLQQTADGGYILGGYSRSEISGDKTQASQGSADYWIVKTDAVGAKQWDARFGGSYDDYLFSLQQTEDGGYILGGQSYSGISGDKTQAGQGAADYWVIKTDAAGIKQWDARFGGNFEDVLQSLQQTADGGYILGGWSYSEISGDQTHERQGFSDYWIVKTDAGGVKQWDARFGGSDNDQLHSLQQTTDGGYILGGWSYSGISGDKSQASQGSADYWIVKTDADGTICPLPTSLYVTNLTTTSAKLNWDAVPGALGYKVRYKISGTSEWTNIQSIDNDKTIHGLIVSTEYVWQVKSICSVLPVTSSAWSEKQFFTTNALKLNWEDAMSLEIYPNPVSSSTTISFSLNIESDVKIELYDVAGSKLQTMIDGKLTAGEHEQLFT
jgi:hypothetical protein